MSTLHIVALAIVVFLVSYHGTRILTGLLARRAILDHPSHRSSHDTPTPRGGGIALLAALLPAWLLVTFLDPAAPDYTISVIVALGVILAVISWVDDLRGLGPFPRLLMQAICIGIALWPAPFPAPVVGGYFPPYIDTAVTALLWLWFINLFNFMDGIDGIAGVQTAGIGIGIFVTAKVGNLDAFWLGLGLTTAAAAFGFLRWNWYPARIFLGDVGSIPLGFLLGWLLLSLAANGHPFPALIMPMYFLADATITLIRRTARGERIWKPHSEHFYQLAIKSGLRHDQVSGIIAVANIFLIMLALVAIQGFPLLAFWGTLTAMTLLLFLFAKGGPTE